MRKFAFFLSLLTLFLPAFAAKLVNFSVYDRDDRVDLMLSFDAPYNGHISQTKKDGIIVVTLNDLTTPKAQSQILKSKLVQKVLITPVKNNTAVALEASMDTSVLISEINNKIGLRIRILKATTKDSTGTGGLLADIPAQNISNLNTNLNSNLNAQNETATPLPRSKSSSLEGFDLKNYLLVLSFLVAILILLWWFKKKLAKTHHFDSKDFKIIFQRALDKNNQFMILEYENKRFVMIIGSSNTLLEVKDAPFSNENLSPNAKNTATNSKAPKEKSFDNFFEENKAKLQKLIQKNS